MTVILRNMAIFIVMVMSLDGWIPVLAGLPEESPLEMKVSLTQQSDGPYSVRVSLRNAGNEPVLVDRATLPWRPGDPALAVSIFRMDCHMTRLKRDYLILDYRKNIFMFTLLPGESLSGDLQLSSIYQNLRAEIRHYGLKIVWECRIETRRDGELMKVFCPDGQGRSFTIPKGENDLK